MKNIFLYGLGNALVDLVVPVSDTTFSSLDLERSSMRLVSIEEQRNLLKQLGGMEPSKSGGGSVANTIYSAASFGVKTSFSASIGDDEFGVFYQDEFAAKKTLFSAARKKGETTGTCLVMITPDAERTMRTCLAASSDFSLSEISEATIKDASWCFIEGYLLANPGKVDAWLIPTLELCRKHDTKIAFTCSESWVVENFRASVDQVLAHASLVFANETEGSALSGKADAASTLEVLKDRFDKIVITAGEKGAYVSEQGRMSHVPSAAARVVDLNGAGDALAGGVFYGLQRGQNLAEATALGCRLAGKVIAQAGARYNGNFEELL